MHQWSLTWCRPCVGKRKWQQTHGHLPQMEITHCLKLHNDPATSSASLPHLPAALWTHPSTCPHHCRRAPHGPAMRFSSHQWISIMPHSSSPFQLCKWSDFYDNPLTIFFGVHEGPGWLGMIPHIYSVSSTKQLGAKHNAICLKLISSSISEPS